MNPKPIPVAMDNVNGIAKAVTTAGAYSVTSSQSISAKPLAIMQATKRSAGAVAYAGIVVASGDRTIATMNRTPTVTAVSPVLPPAFTPAALSI